MTLVHGNKANATHMLMDNWAGKGVGGREPAACLLQVEGAELGGDLGPVGLARTESKLWRFLWSPPLFGSKESPLHLWLTGKRNKMYF